MDSAVLIINSELRLPPAELQYRFARSGGPGGQHVNNGKTSDGSVQESDAKNALIVGSTLVVASKSKRSTKNFRWSAFVLQNPGYVGGEG
jgi:protein subunit release factor A